jgi:hypothetical protein
MRGSISLRQNGPPIFIGDGRRRIIYGVTAIPRDDLYELDFMSRVAKMEAGERSVSLDMLFRGLFALSGGLEDLRAAR